MYLPSRRLKNTPDVAGADFLEIKHLVLRGRYIAVHFLRWEKKSEIDWTAAAQDQCPLDSMFQLSNVSRPTIGLKPIDHTFGKGRGWKP
jgi:hypothetical protein